jgi:hypothetical protein
VLSAAASDLAALQGKNFEDSPDAIMHRGFAIGQVNKRLLMSKPDTSDSMIAAVSLLSGNEVCIHSYLRNILT